MSAYRNSSEGLGVFNVNSANDKAGKSSKIVPAVPIININATWLAAPIVSMTKTQLKKFKAQEKKEKTERARMIAEAKKNGVEFEQTPFVIRSDDTATETIMSSASTPSASVTLTSDVAVRAASASATMELIPSAAEDIETDSPSEHGSSGSSSGNASCTSPQNTRPSRRAELIANGVVGPRQATNKNKKKNRKPLDKAAKKDHAVVNPFMQAFLANKDSRPASKTAWEKFQTANGIRIRRNTPQAASSQAGSPDTLMGGMTPDAGAEEPLEESAPLRVAGPNASDLCASPIREGGFVDQDAEHFFADASGEFQYAHDLIEDGPATAAFDTQDIVAGLHNLDGELEEDFFENFEQLSSDDGYEHLIVEELASATKECIVEDPVASSEELINEVTVGQEPTALKDTVTKESPLTFLSFPNKTEYPPILSRDQELALISAHISPLVLSVAQKKPSRAEKKAAAKAKQLAAPYVTPNIVGEPPVLIADPLVNQDTLPVVEEEPVLAPYSMTVRTMSEDQVPVASEDFKDTYLADFLAMPNGCGQGVAARELEAQLVGLHVAPYVELVSKKRGKMSKHDKKAKKMQKVAATAEVPKNVDSALPASLVIDIPIEVPVIVDWVADIEDISVSENIIIKQEVDNTDSVDISFSTDQFSPQSTPNSKCQSDRDPLTPASLRPSPRRQAPAVKVTPELHRKAHLARNTFLGIHSLEDFLDKLDFEQSDLTTTKEDVCATFAALSTEEFKINQGRHPDAVISNLQSPIAQRKIKMGNTTLYGFLHAIDFEDEVANVSSIVDAFNNAASGSQETSSKVLRALAA
ncbi:hypothetical protein BDU57DRAFT_302369 [Ampelomyces quisqualis]|uniref:Uncharacterized protein n=1 Tax=Ampelomyces quisqualis TaxID=50730 RepID=A0A6A5QIQ9_AMPQU|nr:hypothetical protein BDU57DRAFT_302369 [Ampelomyces quisqualis]